MVVNHYDLFKLYKSDCKFNIGIKSISNQLVICENKFKQ